MIENVSFLFGNRSHTVDAKCFAIKIIYLIRSQSNARTSFTFKVIVKITFLPNKAVKIVNKSPNQM